MIVSPIRTIFRYDFPQNADSDWVDAGEEERNWGLRGTKVLLCFLTPSFTRLQNTVLANDGHHSQGTLLTLPHCHTTTLPHCHHTQGILLSAHTTYTTHSPHYCSRLSTSLPQLFHGTLAGTLVGHHYLYHCILYTFQFCILEVSNQIEMMMKKRIKVKT